MKKKILFAAYSLDIGGIETALVTLINNLANRDYDITLFLEKKQGVFLESVDKRVTIKTYQPSYNKVKVFAKILNGIKRAKFILKHKNKYDCAISFATYSLSSSFIARCASNNSVLWVHNNYLSFFDKNVNEYKTFFENIGSKKFNKIVFVSKEAKDDYCQIIDNEKNNLMVCNNLIDYENILKKSKEDIELDNDDSFIFLNIGRHDEKQKKLSRLLNVCKKLKDDGYKFKLLMVGNGEDTEKYKELVKVKNLEEFVKFVGPQKNPYPYYNACDCVVLTSEFEGYPVVFVEALTLNKPIITTDVSDSMQDIEGKYGVVCQKNEEDIYEKMKEMIVSGYTIKNPFNPKIYNEEIIKKVEYIIEQGEA